MEIRFANKNDNKLRIAELLYETDRYIYPYWFKTKQEGIKVLSSLLDEHDSLFSLNNFIVATMNNQIVGILHFFNGSQNLTFNYSQLANTNFNYNHVVKNYILPLEEKVNKNSAYVFGLRVADAYTRQHIGESLMNSFLKTLKPNTTAMLDVLADNKPALALYLKTGFQIDSTYKGYNGYRMHKPICHSMSQIKN